MTNIDSLGGPSIPEEMDKEENHYLRIEFFTAPPLKEKIIIFIPGGYGTVVTVDVIPTPNAYFELKGDEVKDKFQTQPKKPHCFNLSKKGTYNFQFNLKDKKFSTLDGSKKYKEAIW